MNILIRTKAPHSATAPAQLNETASKQAVEIGHLRKTYGALVAVDDVSFSVAEGEIFGILGPNGAGKTTTVERAIGLRSPDAGTIRLMGLDPQADRDKTHEIVGVQLQTGALLLVIFDLIPAFSAPAADLGGLSRLSVYVPILIVLGLALLAFYNLPVPLVSYRELGILRRLSTTPVPPSWLLAAQGIVNLCMAATMVLIVVVAGTALGAPAPKNVAGLALAVLLSVAGLFPIGLVIAAVARTTTSASV